MEINRQQVRMDYLYRKEKKTKWVPLEQVAQDVRNGKYERLVKGTRGLEAVMTSGGMAVLSMCCPRPGMCLSGRTTEISKL